MDKEDVLVADVEVALDHKPDEGIVEEHLFQGLLPFEALLFGAFLVAVSQAVVEGDEEQKSAQHDHEDAKTSQYVFGDAAYLNILRIVDQICDLLGQSKVVKHRRQGLHLNSFRQRIDEQLGVRGPFKHIWQEDDELNHMDHVPHGFKRR